LCPRQILAQENVRWPRLKVESGSIRRSSDDGEREVGESFEEEWEEFGLTG
jgi:hypothetical protein